MKIKELLALSEEVKMETTDEIRYCVIYARKSSRDDDKQFQSIPDQLTSLNNQVKAKGFTLIKTFTESRSAMKEGRPIFQTMIDFIEKRNSTYLLVWDINRISRNGTDANTISKLLDSGKLNEIVTPTATYDKDSYLSYKVNMLMSEEYSRALSRVVKRSIKSRVDRGIAPYLPPPAYNYDQNKPKGQRDIVDNNFFPIMRKVFDLFLTGNFSVTSLLEEANGLGLRNNKGRIISKARLYKNLKDPFYTGRFMYKGKLYAGTHKRMITDEEYDLVQEILSGRSKPRKKTHEFALNGFIKCGTCGMYWCGEEHTKHYKNGFSQTFSYYRCTKKNKNLSCNEQYINSIELETQVKDFLAKIKVDNEFVDWSIKWLNEINTSEKELRHSAFKALYDQHEEVSQRIDNLTDLWISPKNKDRHLLSEEDYENKLRSLKIQRKNIKENLDKVDKRMDETNELVVRTFNFARIAQERFETGTFEERKTIVRAIGSYLTLSHKILDIQPRTPFLKIKSRLEVLKSKKARLVPTDNVVFMAESSPQDDLNSCWRGQRDSNPQPLP